MGVTGLIGVGLCARLLGDRQGRGQKKISGRVKSIFFWFFLKNLDKNLNSIFLNAI